MLSAQTVHIVKSTAPILATHGNEITAHFYKRMFSRHPELLNIFNHANQRQGRQQAALANAVYAAAANIDNLGAILPVVKQIGHKHRSLGVKPEQYPIVGENLLAAIKEVLGDAATPEIIGAWGEAYGVIADAFIGVERQMYDEAAEATGGWRDFRKFTVQRKVKESAVITSFYLVPADGGKLSPYRPGQYISVRMQIPGEQYTHIRQYSLSDLPGRNYYRISVKREDAAEKREQGIVSNYLHSSIDEGAVVEISAPAGDFVLDTTSPEPLVLLSGGVGITPLTSMLLTVRRDQPEREITFIHAAINGSHHAFREEVKDAVAGSVNAKALFVYERPEDCDTSTNCYHHHGFVNQEWLAQVIPGATATYYFCGPLPFMKAVYRGLKALGVPPENMRYELFGPAANLDSEETAPPMVVAEALERGGSADSLAKA